MIEEIKNFVKESFDKADMKFFKEPYYYSKHILPAYKIALSLVDKYGGDKEIVEISILFHDIGLIDLKENEEHDRKGSEMVTDLIKKYNLSKDKIEKIKACILSHDCKAAIPKTVEEKIITSADALSHLVTPWFIVKSHFYEGTIDKFVGWCIKKLDEDFLRIQFDEEKTKIKPYCETLKKILKEESGL